MQFINGPGKYDEAATAARLATKATGGVVLLVFDGDHGSGFSVQLSPELLLTLPTLLRDAATRIERLMFES
jgi:hypothetical protein